MNNRDPKQRAVLMQFCREMYARRGMVSHWHVIFQPSIYVNEEKTQERHGRFIDYGDAREFALKFVLATNIETRE